MGAYRSRFGATRPITLAQYVAEEMCARQARLKGVSLPQRFWQKPQWSRVFALQAMLTRSFLARFPEEVLLAVLRSPEGKFVASMNNKSLPGLLDAEVKRREQAKAISASLAETRRDEVPPVKSGETTPVVRPPMSRPGSLFNAMR